MTAARIASRVSAALRGLGLFTCPTIGGYGSAHRATFRDVPVDGFWSLTVYNRDGYFEANPFNSYSINSITARLDDSGAVTIDLAPADDGFQNHLYVMDGWNYALRLYRPRPEVLDGSWAAPSPDPVT